MAAFQVTPTYSERQLFRLLQHILTGSFSGSSNIFGEEAFQVAPTYSERQLFR
jgi:hypothetical protein